MLNDELYKSLNLDLSAFLIYKDCVPIKFETKGKRVVFFFSERPKCEQLAKDFDFKAASVEPKAFARAMMDARDMMHREMEK